MWVKTRWKYRKAISQEKGRNRTRKRSRGQFKRRGCDGRNAKPGKENLKILAHCAHLLRIWWVPCAWHILCKGDTWGELSLIKMKEARLSCTSRGEVAPGVYLSCRILPAWLSQTATIVPPFTLFLFPLFVFYILITLSLLLILLSVSGWFFSLPRRVGSSVCLSMFFFRFTCTSVFAVRWHTQESPKH